MNENLSQLDLGNLLSRNKKRIFYGMLPYLIIEICASFFAGGKSEDAGMGGLMGAIIVSLLANLLRSGAILYFLHVLLNMMQNIKEDRSFFSFAGEQGFLKTVVKNMIATFLMALLTVMGFMLFIIPGFLALHAFSYTPLVLLENPNMGIIAAMKESYRLTKIKSNWGMVGAYLVGFVILFFTSFMAGFFLAMLFQGEMIALGMLLVVPVIVAIFTVAFLYWAYAIMTKNYLIGLGGLLQK